MDPEHPIQLQQLVNRAKNLSCLTMDQDIQERTISELDEASALLSETKKAHVRRGDSDASNELLVTELFVSACRSELKMWLQLKREEYEQAWDGLVVAQTTLNQACQVARQQELPTEHLVAHLTHLEAIEKCVFPPQHFVSLGARVESFQCSLCGRDYDDCEEHIAGLAYDGELCGLVTVGPLRTDHVALVSDPEDKRCRATEVSIDGFLRNTMTGRRGAEAPDGYAKVTLAVADEP